MTPGSNIPLPATCVTVDVTAPVRLDVSGLLLTADGKVRSDDDFVFYNQPNGPGVAHRSASAGVPDAISVDTAAVPAAIDKVVVTASLDGPGGNFAGTEPTATVRDTATGAVLATFTPPRLGTETALVVVELYRRAGAWKLRAVGQGYANGLAGIATDFGVTVEEPAGEPAGEPAPVAAPIPPAPPAPAAAPAKVSLDKGRVSLRKNETVSLVKNGRPLAHSVRMGLGWEPAYGRRSIDLDASVIAYGPDRRPIDTCYFGKLMILDGAIQHSGDNLTGAGSGDDETITVHLGGLPPNVTGLVFTVNSFSGQKFTDVAKAYCRLVDAQTGEELVRYDLTGSEPTTGVLMAKFIRQYSGEWEMTALGRFVKARTARELVRPGGEAL
ncbi:TerD family protein [Streptomyces orinoci]|uniref:TerD family protein n=1 Tax=Streptomyces orinoci TaxID=67339 RepID=A0ABV3JWY4_STRON|nr:TerD family protein [Streptomyces orinoci]